MPSKITQDKHLREMLGGIKKILVASGLIMLIVGTYTALYPEEVSNHISMLNKDTSIALSVALIVAGFSDIVAVIILSRSREKR